VGASPGRSWPYRSELRPASFGLLGGGGDSPFCKGRSRAWRRRLGSVHRQQRAEDSSKASASRTPELGFRVTAEQKAQAVVTLKKAAKAKKQTAPPRRAESRGLATVVFRPFP
jgi:hypothetical protein